MKAFKYACFISYCHGQGALVSSFIEQLKTSLKACLEPYFDTDECVYIDEDRLKSGALYNTGLADAICRSMSMIVVYMPKYEHHSYCLREYTAMERLEAERFKLSGNGAAQDRGMIIPILFRGRADDLPERIRKHRHFCDFSKFTTATSDILKNEEFVRKIEEIASYIYDLSKEFDSLAANPCSNCSSFQLPAETEVKPWHETIPVTPFVFRQQNP
ncbi:MAG: toll/interleukin-1 receptor domain-containing protein [Ignavibacteriae bacterium]|nr:toll/interleukin-1 receptor domain-containing protein [Ignavibacteriota bacterium]